MTEPDRRLTRHLVLAVLLKVLALALLWQFLLRDQRVDVDSQRAAAALVDAAPAAPIQEVPHDQ